MVKSKKEVYNHYTEQLVEVSKHNTKDNLEQIKQNAEIYALAGLIDEQWIIVSVTHTRDFDHTKVYELVEIWRDPIKVADFSTKYKLSVKLYPVNLEL